MSKKLSRRTFLKLAGSALLVAGAGGVYYKQNELARLATRVTGEARGLIDASFVRQIVAADNKTARTIMWQSPTSLVAPAVELTRGEAAETQRFPQRRRLSRRTA